MSAVTLTYEQAEALTEKALPACREFVGKFGDGNTPVGPLTEAEQATLTTLVMATYEKEGIEDIVVMTRNSFVTHVLALAVVGYAAAQASLPATIFGPETPTEETAEEAAGEEEAVV